MDKKYIIAIICVLAIIAVALIIAMGGGDNTSSNSSQNTDTGSSYQGYQVRITTEGSWSGSVGSINSATYDGKGNKVIDVENVEHDILTAVIQKSGGNSGELKVEILKDGNVIKEGSTTAAYGVVTVSSS